MRLTVRRRPLSSLPARAAGVLALPLFLLAGCDRHTGDAPVTPPHPVGVITTGYRPVSVHATLPGRVSALRVAEVRPQVSGILLHQAFTGGATVKAGDLLWQIDPAPFSAALAQARGALAQAQAAAAQAHRTEARDRALVAPGYISPQELDMARAQAQQADAQVQSAQAGVEQARINLGYTAVRAPVTGTIGKPAVTEGALVSTGQADALAVIQQLDTVYVDLAWTADAWLRLQAEVAAGRIHSGKGRLPVTVTSGSGRTVNCSFLFTDVSVDETTGALDLRAQCPNTGHDLLPGMFISAELDQGVREQAITVPQQAVSRLPDGTATVIVVTADNKAVLRQVVVTDAAGDRWRVTSGLQSGEKIVVTGQMRLRPGMAVAPVNEPDISGEKGA